MTNPEEVLTLVYCRGCEMSSLAGDVKPSGHCSDDTGHQLECPRCNSRLNAESFHDYVDMRVVNYG